MTNQPELICCIGTISQSTFSPYLSTNPLFFILFYHYRKGFSRIHNNKNQCYLLQKVFYSDIKLSSFLLLLQRKEATDARLNVRLSLVELAKSSSIVVYLMCHARRQLIIYFHLGSKLRKDLNVQSVE